MVHTDNVNLMDEIEGVEEIEAIETGKVTGRNCSQFRRRQRALHIKRKERIIKELGGYWSYKHRGMLSKGKIHCSCPMCSAKRKTHGMKHSELRKIPVEE